MADKLEALKINSTTYPVYQASGEPNQYPLSQINNLFLVKNPAYPGGWGWFDEADFHTYYKWLVNPPESFTAFSEVTKQDTDD